MTDERKGECDGRRDKCTLGDACPKFGLLGRAGRDGTRRVKGCGDPVARGKRNRSKGDGKARMARKRLGIGGANTRHEELWGGQFRLEVKAGAQIETRNSSQSSTDPLATADRSCWSRCQMVRAMGCV